MLGGLLYPEFIGQEHQANDQRVFSWSPPGWLATAGAGSFSAGEGIYPGARGPVRVHGI